MPDVCGPEMCEALAEAGALGILHRFQSVDEEVAQFHEASRTAGTAAVGAAVGVTGDYRERFDALVEAGCRIVCLDTANGAHEQVGTALVWARERRDDVTLVAGNVASAEAFAWLEDRGADAIRVGIAGGAVCETRTETGVFVPTPYAVAEAARVAAAGPDRRRQRGARARRSLQAARPRLRPGHGRIGAGRHR